MTLLLNHYGFGFVNLADRGSISQFFELETSRYWPCESPLPYSEAKRIWLSVVQQNLKRSYIPKLLADLLLILPRSDLDTQALAGAVYFCLAGSPLTRCLYGTSADLGVPELEQLADRSDLAVQAFHAHLIFNLNTNLLVEQSCVALLQLLSEQTNHTRFPHLIQALLCQFVRNCGLWRLPDGLIHQLACSVDFMPEFFGTLDPHKTADQITNFHPVDADFQGKSSSPSDPIACFYDRFPSPTWRSLDLIPFADFSHYVREHVSSTVAEALGGKVSRILVTACGTGREAIGWASLFPSSVVDAIDVSASSLSYAAQKAACFGVTNLRLAQLDLEFLPAEMKSYDLIICCGVLHHLINPLNGLKQLLCARSACSMLKLSLYSQRARSHLRFAAEQMRLHTDGDYSRQSLTTARQALIDRIPELPEVQILSAFQDFFDVHALADLLLNPREHLFTIPEVADLLDQLGLSFLGFELPGQQLKAQYLSLFPHDRACTNLNCWHAFEDLFPATFLGMYCFWCQ